MMIGEVTPGKEAIVRLTIEDGQGQEQAIRAVIDTGFTEHLTLPTQLVDVWGLPFVQFSYAVLADGTHRSISVHEARVHWNNQVFIIPVYATEGTALVGMSLLYGCSLTMQIIDGGMVTIEAIS